VESLEAVHFGIEALKMSVPIRKKELYSEGAPEWKANKECL
jgi:molybdopterin synthase catalytic subunit